MSHIKTYLFYALIGLSSLLILLTLFSLIYDLKFWYYKILDFPRMQYLLLGLLFLVLFSLFNTKWTWPSLALLFGLMAVIAINGIVIYPYWFGEKAVADFDATLPKPDATFGVLLANILIDNRQSDSFLNRVQELNPDILLAMEVDDWWVRELEVLKDQYPYVLEYPLSNAYGMALYSKFPMTAKDIKFLKHSDVPSFHVIMTLPSGQSFHFYGIHPVAPIPSARYPDNVGEAEVALLKIGKLVADNPLPSLVAGDFNDVSWSNTSRLFGEQGGLNNVRIGRGLYNSFNASSFVFLWPLDHFFVTKEFKLVDLKLLDSFGSDHYPFYAEFVLEP